MATTKELKARKKILENQIASILKVDITTGTAQSRLDAQKRVEPLRDELREVNLQLSGKSKPETKGPVVDANKEIDIASNAPSFITQDIAAQLLAGAQLDISNVATFAAGGPGSTAFIWESDKPGTMGRQGFKSAPNVKLASTEITNFWNDEALQKKIMGSYAAKGRSITRLEAFSVWENLVKTAASIYQGGRGAKVTPMQLLADTLKGVGGGEATLPQRTVSVLDKDTTFRQIDNWSSNTLMRKLNDNEKESLFTLLNDLNTGTVTEYKKVRNKKGVLENVATTTPGLTDAEAQRTVEDRLKELNPDDVDRVKRIEWSSWLSQNMGGV